MVARNITTLYPKILAPFMPILNTHRNPTILYRVLYWIAHGGLSTRSDIAMAIGLNMSTSQAKNISIQRVARACTALAKDNLIEQNSIRFWRMKLFMLRLTDHGRKYCQDSYPWKVRQSDWDKLYKRHNGHVYREHSAAVLNFAYHARLRGWNTTVMPYILDTFAEPDLALSQKKENTFVEIEMRGWRAKTKQKKWQQQITLQGRAAVCLLTSESAYNVFIRFEELGYLEYAVTSLEYLQNTAYNDKKNRLWEFTTEDPHHGTR